MKKIFVTAFCFLLLLSQGCSSEPVSSSNQTNPSNETTEHKPTQESKMSNELVNRLDIAIKQMKGRLSGDNENTTIKGVEDVKGKAIDNKTYEIQIITSSATSQPWQTSIDNDFKLETYTYSREVIETLGKESNVVLRVSVYVNNDKNSIAQSSINVSDANFNNVF